MDPIPVQAFANFPRQLHVPRRSLAFEVKDELYVKRGNQLGVTQLPDVKMMGRNNARELLDVGFDVIDVDSGRYGLEEDAGCGFAERDGGCEDDEGDD